MRARARGHQPRRALRPILHVVDELVRLVRVRVGVRVMVRARVRVRVGVGVRVRVRVGVVGLG